MTRLLMVCGSQRDGSHNARLLDAIAAIVPPAVVSDRLLAAQACLPLFNPDEERAVALGPVLPRLHARFAAADALIVACPEYNGTMTPYFKNLVDWISRLPHLDPGVTNAFLDKPVLIASASPGWSGGGVAVPSLRALLGHVGAVPFGETVCLPYADRAWRADGSLDPAFAGQYWQACVARFCALAARSTRVPA